LVVAEVDAIPGGSTRRQSSPGNTSHFLQNAALIVPSCSTRSVRAAGAMRAIVIVGALT
jgi:hypothetical protein